MVELRNYHRRFLYVRKNEVSFTYDKKISNRVRKQKFTKSILCYFYANNYNQNKPAREQQNHNCFSIA